MGVRPFSRLSFNELELYSVDSVEFDDSANSTIKSIESYLRWVHCGLGGQCVVEQAPQVTLPYR